ncbi:MAG TPA: tetratricopeptide repeat protein [Thermoanaerobaculia bacterium]|nr:tetratricopeptide repeat protein [Thermoanaerobaculia bacterium]
MNDDEKFRTFGRMLREPDPERVREFAATARKLQAERETSAEVVDRLLRETPADQWPSLVLHDDLRNSGALERLGKEVSNRLERNPREAMTLAALATGLADGLPANAYPPVVVAQIRAHAWKDRGQALCYLAKYDDALEALARAEALLDAFGTLAHDRAVVRFVRATTLQQMNRFDESREILGDCKDVFNDHGDSRLYLYCAIAEGMLLYRNGDYRAAHERWRPLLQIAHELHDTKTEARLHHNLGNSASHLGELDSANMHLSQALAMFTDLGWFAEAVRIERTTGRLYLNRGDRKRGMSRLTDARRKFLLHGMVEEAGLCGLEMVEALLGWDDADEAAAIASEIAQQFSDAGLNNRAVTAIEYLHEAIEARRASAKTANNVRSYVEALRVDPEREFVGLA